MGKTIVTEGPYHQMHYNLALTVSRLVDFHSVHHEGRSSDTRGAHSWYNHVQCSCKSRLSKFNQRFTHFVVGS